MNKEVQVFGKWVSFGYSFKGFGLGFRISTWDFNLDLGFFWFGIEF